MAELKPNGEIYYRSVEEFLDEYKTHIYKGGLYLDTQQAWPLRKVQQFTIRVEGAESSVDISAEVVFLGENKVGLQLHISPDEKTVLDAFRMQIESLISEGSRPVPAPAQTSEATSTPEEEETQKPQEITGQIVVPKNLDEFRTAAPVELGSPDFRSITIFRLVASIAASRTALALTILRKGEQHCFRFNDKGNLVQYLGPEAGEDLLDRLVHDRLITRHVQQEVLAELSETKFAEAILLERKLVKLASLWSAVKNQVIDVFENIRSQSGASFRIDAINTGRRTGISFGSLIIPWMSRALMDLDNVQFEKLLEPMWDRYPIVQAEPKWPVSSMAIGAKGSRFLEEYLNGNRTLSEAIDIYPLTSREQALKAVVILRSIDVLVVHDRAVDSDEESDPELFLERELESLAKKDMFAQAGMHWSAHVDDFPEAMAKLERKFGPGSKLARYSDEAARQCKARLDLAKDAQRFLKDKSNRKKHRQEVVGEYQMKNSADLLFKQAQLQLLKQNVRKARQLIETAIEMDPKQEYIQKLNSI